MARSPLYDIYDPYGLLEQQAQFGMLPGQMPGEQRRPSLSDLMPEEEQQGLLRTLANAGSSGLGTLGWLLDTPGSILRGTLSAGPLKGLSALWESSDDRVTGRELLRQYGLAGEEDTWSNFAAGLGAEVLLDPLTYGSFGLNAILGKGAKTLAGRYAGRAGLLDDFDVYARSLTRADGTPMGSREAYRTQSIASLLDAAPTDAVRDQYIRNLQNASPRLRSQAAFNALRGGGVGPIPGQAVVSQGWGGLFGRRAGLRADQSQAAFNALLGGNAKALQGADAEAYRLLTSPLAGTNRLGLPFMDEGAFDLYGQAAGDFIARQADRFGEGLKTNRLTGPIVRRASTIFNPDVLGMTDYERQWDARKFSAAERQRLRADRTDLARLSFDADTALRAAGTSLQDTGLSQSLRDVWEFGDEAVELTDYEQYLQIPEVKNLVEYFRNYRTQARERAAGLGIPLNEFYSRSGTEFFPRQQLQFDSPQTPTWPEGVRPPTRDKRQYSRGSRPVNLTDNFGAGRRQYTDIAGGTRSLNVMSEDAGLQQALRSADRGEAQRLLEEYNRDGADLYGWVDELDSNTGRHKYKVPDLPETHPLYAQRKQFEEAFEQARVSRNTTAQNASQQALDGIDAQVASEARTAHKTKLYGELADFLRQLDPQHASRNRPVFGQNVMNELGRYVTGRGRVESNAEQMLQLLRRNVVEDAAEDVAGGVNYTAEEALKRLGFAAGDSGETLADQLGISSLDGASFNKAFVDDWTKATRRISAPEEVSPLVNAYDNFTKSFKTLALLYPSRYTRDKYSGSFAAASIGAFNPLDEYAGYYLRQGNYRPLARRLSGAPGFEDLAEEERVRKFLTEAAGEGLGVSTYADDITAGSTASRLREMYPGQARPTWSQIGERAYNPNRTWRQALSDFNPFAVRTASGNRNPLLELGDRAAETTDAMNRYGSYLTMIRRGVAPSKAKRLTDLTQVDYGKATRFENEILKRLIPFYSYTRGITPYIADQVVNKPSGALGVATRIVNRGGEPSEDTFVPDYLRQRASIPLPGDPESGLRRFLTNIDLPFESTVNLFTPGSGNTLYEKVANTVRGTAQNLAGQLNPALKGPLEQLTNRQFYSGRELSDLYSTLEQTLGPPGRALEQIGYNLPGGSRAIGAYRQLTDQRLDPLDRYFKFGFNALTGLRLQDVDMDRTRRLAARNMLNEVLESTPGVRTYENITVPDEALQAMPEEQRRLYLLYKIIQSEAAKKGRERKKAEAALDPMQALGIG